VANTGPAVSQTDAQRIFQPFQRLNDRASHDGAGLGLTIVASIATIHGGIATADPRKDGRLSRHGHHPFARRCGIHRWPRCGWWLGIAGLPGSQQHRQWTLALPARQMQSRAPPTA